MPRLIHDTTLRNPETGKHVTLKAGTELPDWVPGGRIVPHHLAETAADAPSWRIVDGDTVLNAKGNFVKSGAAAAFDTEAAAAERLAEVRHEHPDAVVEAVAPTGEG